MYRATIKYPVKNFINKKIPTQKTGFPRCDQNGLRRYIHTSDNKDNYKQEYKYGFPHYNKLVRNDLILESRFDSAIGGLLTSLLLFGFANAFQSEVKAEEEKDKKESSPSVINLSADDNSPATEAILSYAPCVPPPIDRDYPIRLRVNLESSVKVMPIDTLYDYEFWTFNGHVPGPFIRARQGDVMEVHLTNKDDTGMLHNNDFHAVMGQGGGAPLLTAQYNQEKVASFKLLHPGLFIYHCAVDPVGLHIGNGMYGLMLVEPKEGLPKVDKEFYVLQSEFYTEESPEDSSSKVLPFSFDKATSETPNYVVFNGQVGSTTQEKALQVKAGDRVRIFFGNAGPNLPSSFHIIGTIFDKVYREADLISPPARTIQTTLVPSGGATVVEFDAIVPGVLTLVDHSIWRIEKGAVGFIQVTGEPRTDIYHSEEPPNPCASCKTHP